MASLTDKRVLITGITGFTGLHLENELNKKGYDVFGTTLSVSKKKNHYECDILKLDELRSIVEKVKPNYVFHLAAISFVKHKNISKIYEVNIEGTLNLMKALEALQIKPKKIVVASSASVYGNIGSELSEEMCPKPVNHYGNSKLAMEHMVANYFNQYKIILTRPFNYTGKGHADHFLVPKIVGHFKAKKKKIALGNINTFREYNDIGFLVDCYCRLMLSDFDSGVVNIASGNTHSINEILTTMKELSDMDMSVEINPAFVRKNEIIELKGSSKRLEGIIGVLNQERGLKDTLKEMFTN